MTLLIAIPLGLCLALPSALDAQSAPTSQTSAIVTTGAFFALSVADVKASARWYADKLGLRIVMDTPKRDKATATVLEGGGLIVELVQHDDAVALGKAAPAVPGGSLFVHGIFKAGAIVENFEKTLATLKSRNVEIAMGPFPARAGQRANVVIKDNAGNFIQLFGK